MNKLFAAALALLAASPALADPRTFDKVVGATVRTYDVNGAPAKEVSKAEFEKLVAQDAPIVCMDRKGHPGVKGKDTSYVIFKEADVFLKGGPVCVALQSATKSAGSTLGATAGVVAGAAEHSMSCRTAGASEKPPFCDELAKP